MLRSLLAIAKITVLLARETLQPKNQAYKTVAESCNQ